MTIELCGIDQLYPPVTIEVLPSAVLVEIFSFYVDRRPSTLSSNEDTWHTLVHVCRQRRFVVSNEDTWHTLVQVCRQWRFVVFGSPRRLNLRLLCTPKRSLKMLDIWPALPIVIDLCSKGKRPRGMANIVAALKQHCRVHAICILRIPNSLMKKFAAMKKPFPELTYMKLYSADGNVQILPDSFLGGSAPRLHTLDLCGIPFPAVGKLLLSTRNLVTLCLGSIPHSGYISPEAMVTCLSTLTGLKSFNLGFQSPRSRVVSGTRRLPPLMHINLTALIKFTFKGNSEYLEDIVSFINAPLLDHFEITFFNQLIIDTPLLRHFISRTEIIKAHYRAQVEFHKDLAEVKFSPPREATVHKGLFLRISCTPSDWQLSSIAQVCSSFSPPLYTSEHLSILSYPEHWKDDIESTQWMELLSPFTSVKNLVLYDGPLVGPILQELAGE